MDSCELAGQIRPWPDARCHRIRRETARQHATRGTDDYNSRLSEAGNAPARRIPLRLPTSFTEPSDHAARARRWSRSSRSAALPAHASMFSGDTLDAVANGIAWVRAAHRADRRHRALLDRARDAGEDRAQAPPSAGRGDPHAVPAVAGVRRPALADRLALGLHQADRLSRWPTAPTSTRTITSRWPTRRAAGKLSEAELAHLRDELDAMARARRAAAELQRAARAARRAAARPTPRAAEGTA